MLHPAAVCCLALVLAYRVNYTDYSQGGARVLLVQSLTVATGK